MKKILFNAAILFAGMTFITGVQAQAQKFLCPDSNHPHAIDMGAAGKWACCNVGASKPTEYGGYYTWGVTEMMRLEYSTYMTGISGKKEYDVATSMWGKGWRMPTYDHFERLKKCSKEWMKLDGVEGLMFTASNGNIIFLPFAGWRLDTEYRQVGKNGSYWSDTHIGWGREDAYCFDIFPNTTLFYEDKRYFGRSVRPIAE